mmetsp:Transcript_47087/g.100116  ORF Transcript_47087/g.100116 Transcript_47087/m.100116 type:complete len:217 (+) Transcript_47087:732-1382(+)
MVHLVSASAPHVGKVRRGGAQSGHAHRSRQGQLRHPRPALQGREGHGLPHPALVQGGPGRLPRLQNGQDGGRADGLRQAKARDGAEVQGLGDEERGEQGPEQGANRPPRRLVPSRPPRMPGVRQPHGEPRPRELPHRGQEREPQPQRGHDQPHPPREPPLLRRSHHQPPPPPAEHSLHEEGEARFEAGAGGAQAVQPHGREGLRHRQVPPGVPSLH